MRIALAIAALALCPGCGVFGSLSPAKQAQLDLLECRAQALAPAVEPVFDAVELARDIYAGRASLPAVLKALGAGEEDVQNLVEAFKACEPPAQMPAAIDPS